MSSRSSTTCSMKGVADSRETLRLIGCEWDPTPRWRRRRNKCEEIILVRAEYLITSETQPLWETNFSFYDCIYTKLGGHNFEAICEAFNELKKLLERAHRSSSRIGARGKKCNMVIGLLLIIPIGSPTQQFVKSENCVIIGLNYFTSCYKARVAQCSF